MTTAVPECPPATADRYRPVLVYWQRGLGSSVVRTLVVGLLRRDDRASAAAACGDRSLVLAFARGPRESATDRVRRRAQQVVELVGRQGHGAHPRAIIAAEDVPADDVPRQARRLLGLRRYVDTRPPADPVVAEQALELPGLLDEIDHGRAAEFVEHHLGGLLSYDRTHHTRLAHVLELGLGAPNRDEAARAAYMHRNTFRRHFQHAQELVGLEPDDGDHRLAVHLALRLTHVVDPDHDPGSARHR